MLGLPASDGRTVRRDRRPAGAGPGGRGCGIRQDRDDGRPGRVPGGQRHRAPGSGPRTDLHPQGGDLARRSDPDPAAGPGASGSPTRGHRPAHRGLSAAEADPTGRTDAAAGHPTPHRAVRSRTHGEHLPLLRRPVDRGVRSAGRDRAPPRAVLSPTAAWQLARQVVGRWDGDLAPTGPPTGSPRTCLAMAGALADHLAGTGDLDRELGRSSTDLRSAPPSPRQRAALHSGLVDALRRLDERRAILPLVEAFAEAKRARARGRLLRPDAAGRQLVRGSDAGRVRRCGSGSRSCCSTNIRTPGTPSG